MNPDRPSNLFAVTIWCHSEPVWTWPTKCPHGISYMKGQIEEGGSGKRHYQFYLRTMDRIRRTGVKKLLNCHHAHVEACYKNEVANANYCSKSKTQVEELPDLVYSALSNPPKHPIDYLLEPNFQMCYQRFPEAKDCGEAMAILLSDPSRFADRTKWVDFRSRPSDHSSNCRCLDKYK